MPREWRPVVDGMSDIQKKIHLAFRQTSDNVDATRRALLNARRREYEATITELAKLSGCGEKMGRLREGPTLTEINDMSRVEAEGIVNTYNYDLALAIVAIRESTPRANRYTYAKRLEAWHTNRAEAKDRQIAIHTNLTGRSLAQRDFAQLNGLAGKARLMGPGPVCPICQGWMMRGWVDIKVALRNPAPYHLNCPHWWDFKPEPVDDCQELWVG